jgi:hypothetical protein
VRGRWASLPRATVAQPHRSFDFCRSVFVEAGGTLADDTQPAAPIEDHSTQIGSEPTQIGSADNSNSVTQGGPVPILLSLLPAVLGLFAPRAQAALQKVTGAAPDVVEQFAKSVIDKVSELTGKPDPIQAVAAITADPKPATVQAVQEHALDYLDKLAPVLEKLAGFDQQVWQAEEGSRTAAAGRSADLQREGVWSNPAFIVAILILLMVGGVVFTVLYRDVVFAGSIAFSSDMQSFVIGAVVGSAFTAVVSFFFGSSRSSSAKDVLIGEMARQSKG